MHRAARFSKRVMKALPIAILWLGVAAAGAGLTRQDDPRNAAPAPRQGVKADTDEAPPVTIVVSKTRLAGDEVEYSYEVVNGGAIPVTGIKIGESLYGSELVTWPIGATPDSIPPKCYTSPTGWGFKIYTTEEESTKCLRWARTDTSYEVFPGHSLGGFSVKLPHADALYETCSYTAYLNDGEKYEGVVRHAPASLPSSSARSGAGHPFEQGTPSSAGAIVPAGKSIDVIATETALVGGGVRYAYQVNNGSAIPVAGIRIGYDLHWEDSQLLAWPVGATADTVPPSCYTSPPGWEFALIRTEGKQTLYLDWTAMSREDQLLGGSSLGGFSVVVSAADSAYSRGSWTAYMNNGDRHGGTMQNPASRASRPMKASK